MVVMALWRGARARRGGGTATLLPRFHGTLAFQKVEALNMNMTEKKEGPFVTALAIHGLLGSSRNLRGFCNGLASAALRCSPPHALGWEVILVDLRNHGSSSGFDPPHSILSATQDIAQLIKSQALRWPEVVIGHSLGGKVALEFGKNCAEGIYGTSTCPPKQLWVLDAVPSKILNAQECTEVDHVLEIIKSFPNPMPSRRWLLEELTKRGFSKSLVGWLGSSVKRINSTDEELTWVFNLEGACDMYDSYRQLDYWSFLEKPPVGMEINIVRAELSDRWNPSIVSKLESLTSSNSRSQLRNVDQGTLNSHLLPKAGHWLHADNPQGLIDLMAPFLVKLSF